MSVTIDPEVLERAGDFNLDEIVIKTITNDSVDFKAAFSEINLYESIYTNSISGNISIRDSQNFIQRYAISGQETIAFNVHTPGSEGDDQINLKDFPMRVYKVSDKVTTQEREQVYTLHFTTQESIRNMRNRISRAYTGTTSDIARKILTDKEVINTNKNIYLEESSGIHKMVFPYMQPFNAITTVAKRSESKEYDTPGFLFYETHRGYNFRSYESLTHDQRVPRPDRMLFTDMPYARKAGNPAMRDIEFDMSTIKEFRIIKTNDLVADTMTGMLSTTHYTHDIHTKTWTKNEYNYLDNFYNRLHIDQNEVKTDYNASFGSLYSLTPESSDNKRISEYPKSKILVSSRATSLHSQSATDPRTYDNRSNVWLQKSLSNKISTNSIKMEMTVHGNTYLAAGDVIRINLTSNEPHSAGDERIYDEYFSGRWLITHCRHIINPREHETVIECVKDTYFNALPTGDPIDAS